MLHASLDDGDFVEVGISPPEPCPYLPSRDATVSFGSVPLWSPCTFDDLLARGYRRYGPLFYRPACPGGCRECVPIRIPVDRFLPSKGQRRLLRRTRGRYTIRRLEATFHPEHLGLYNRHARRVSADATPLDRKDYERFLLRSLVDTHLFEYRIADRLAGVGVLDVGSTAASSAYFCWEPDLASFSPGTFSVLTEIEWCRRSGLRYYYLGYWIRDCRSMAYKNRFRPHELLDWSLGSWVASHP